jgi:hypothetical protein
VELALRARAFSSLSALKKISSGDSSLWTWVLGGATSKGVERLLDGEPSLRDLEPFIPGDSGTDFEKKLGMGRADGAGDA